MTIDPVLPDKILLLMEETACDRAEAELAMSLAGFDLEKAIKTIGTLLRHIVVVKGKFADPRQNLYGLLLLIADTRRDQIIRARAVVSYNPAIYETGLNPHWYDFERAIYAARLAEGSLQQVSQDLERSFVDRLQARRDEFFSALKSPTGTNLAGVITEAMSPTFPAGLQSEFSPEVIDWNQFRGIPTRNDERSVPRAVNDLTPVETTPHLDPTESGSTLRVRMELVSDPAGPKASEVQVGDRVDVILSDPRDIAQYVARLFGAVDESGPRPFAAPVETVQRDGGRIRLHLRLSAGILGTTDAPDDAPIRRMPRGGDSWWRRLLPK